MLQYFGEGKGTTFPLYFLITREDIAEEGLAVSMSEYLGNEESILVVCSLLNPFFFGIGYIKLLIEGESDKQASWAQKV